MTATATAHICNTRGLHARASAKFVKLASTFDAQVHVTRDGVTVNALSIMGLLMLGAGNGSTIDISAEGAEAEAALGTVQGTFALLKQLEYAGQQLAWNANAVVGHRHQPGSPGHDVHINLGGAGINGVFEDFLED